MTFDVKFFLDVNTYIGIYIYNFLHLDLLKFFELMLFRCQTILQRYNRNSSSLNISFDVLYYESPRKMQGLRSISRYGETCSFQTRALLKPLIIAVPITWAVIEQPRNPSPPAKPSQRQTTAVIPCALNQPHSNGPRLSHAAVSRLSFLINTSTSLPQLTVTPFCKAGTGLSVNPPRAVAHASGKA